MSPPTQSQMTYSQTLLISPSKTTQTKNPIHKALSLIAHPEGGYFAETDRDPLQIPNPFHGTEVYPNATTTSTQSTDGKDTTPTRNASTTIFYYLDPQSPAGVFHRNKGRTVHTLHRGRGIYILIHADEATSSSSKARIETFTVGHDVEKGERLQWIVDGGKFKASFLLPDADGGAELLISETVVPGFEYMDHDFLTAGGLGELVEEEDREALKWLLRREEREKVV